MNCKVIDLGIIDYKKAYDFQKKYAQEVLNGSDQVLILCEHPTVLTMGRLAKEYNVLFSKDKLKERGVEVLNIDRGGDVTLHTRGQLIAYPILNLANYDKDLRKYLYKLEQVVIDLLSDFDIVANRLSGKTGAWVGDKKIASIGIGVRKWVSIHGLALNVNTDLNQFAMINPCGLDVSMTSVAQVIGVDIEISKVKQSLIDCFCKQFELIKG
ncbi:MAG: lipoyl(octanoyl) transferase LipB [Candidatus Omnitrophica bacterium]|nr:lipoyl(octanoyl) transferase LipB [Candidatus Omnitrophota bacterium]MBU1996115.1 lipoyl(octanoyl) transferase LipB [Candidatus Omnitrophota bacterium]MBU4333359.1 lipoyl(octanoyl) transferase LipB [Candidatus Omnitrophota bacterium]